MTDILGKEEMDYCRGGSRGVVSLMRNGLQPSSGFLGSSVRSRTLEADETYNVMTARTIVAHSPAASLEAGSDPSSPIRYRCNFRYRPCAGPDAFTRSTASVPRA